MVSTLTPPTFTLTLCSSSLLASGLTTITPVTVGSASSTTTSIPVSTFVFAAYLVLVAAKSFAAWSSTCAAIPLSTAMEVTPSKLERLTAFASSNVSPGSKSSAVTATMVTLCSPPSSFTASATLILPLTALICFAVKLILDSISSASIPVQLELTSKLLVPDTVSVSVSLSSSSPVSEITMLSPLAARIAPFSTRTSSAPSPRSTTKSTSELAPSWTINLSAWSLPVTLASSVTVITFLDVADDRSSVISSAFSVEVKVPVVN